MPSDKPSFESNHLCQSQTSNETKFEFFCCGPRAMASKDSAGKKGIRVPDYQTSISTAALVGATITALTDQAQRKGTQCDAYTTTVTAPITAMYHDVDVSTHS